MRNLKKYSILCIDDNEFIKEIYKNLFSILFKEVHIASDGKEGLEIFKKISPDIILTDEKMPKMGGIDMIKEIRKINKEIPIILVSGSEEKEMKDKLKNLKILGIIKKPITKENIFNLLNKL